MLKGTGLLFNGAAMIERLLPRFEPVVSLGQILTVITFITIGIGAWYQIKSEITMMEFRIDLLDKSFLNTATVLRSLTDMQIADTKQMAQIDALNLRMKAIDKYNNDTFNRLLSVEKKVDTLEGTIRWKP